MLSDSLTSVTIKDLKWAVETRYETDIKWLALNIVSLLSQDKKFRSSHRRDFKELVGRPLYTPTSHPAISWCGWWEDVVDLVSVMLKLPRCVVSRQLYSLSVNEGAEISVRLRYFSYSSKKPVFGESAQLKKDDHGKPYMWIISQGKLKQVPEQLLKEHFILWDNRDLFETNHTYKRTM